MAKVNTILEDNIFLRYFVITTGMFISAIGTNVFLKPAHLLSGGVTGLAVAVNYLTGLNVGLLQFLINIPIFIIGFIYLEKEFCITSLINMILFSFILGITQPLGHVFIINDLFLQTIYGGVLTGIGAGIVFRTKSSLGGTDIIGAILKFKKNVPIKNTSLTANLFIVILGGFLFGLNIALYTLVDMFLNVSTMNYTKDALNEQKQVMVISEKNEEISKEIMARLIRGVTFIEAEGAYTKVKKKIIYCIVASHEIPKIKEIALKYDKKSFISVNNIDEVKGKGFKEKYL